jgi:tetratricopeptide (TPR) repeat protein
LIKELPAVVSIWRDSDRSDSFLGSGCLLDRRHILTAQHLLAGSTTVYIGLIAGAADRYRAHMLVSHDEHDAAILKMEAETPLLVSSPVLLHEHRSLAGEPIHLLAISPLSKSRYESSNYSIGGYDEIHGEYELSPDNARGHSGGVVIWNGILVGLLFARAIDDPLCRAVAVHRLYPWIQKNIPAAAVWRDQSPSLRLSLTWNDTGPPEIILIRPASVQGNWLALTNHGSGNERVNRMVLMAQVVRDVPDGMTIPVPAFQLIPDSSDELGRHWTEVYPGQFHFDGPVTLQSDETWKLPALSLEWNEEEIDSHRQLDRLVGLASLSIQLKINIYSESQDISEQMRVALRVLDGEHVFGDGGVQALVDALHPESEAQREELVRRYRGVRRVTEQIWDEWIKARENTREAKRLEELAEELAELEEEVSLQPSDSEPLLRLASRYIQEQLPLTATKTLDRAWDLELRSAQQLLHFAEMQIELENREKALSALEKVTGTESNSGRYFGLKAEALDDEAPLTQALTNFDEAVAREPSSFRWHSGRGRILTGFADHLDEALHEFDLAIKLGADGAVIHGYRGIVLANQKKYDDAIVACREAVALGNTNVSTFNLIADLMPAGPRRRLLDILRATLGKEKAE